MAGQIAIVTGTDAPNLTEDGRQVCETLRDWGFDAEPVVWSDRNVGWSEFDAALVRSCWKYYTQPDEFRNWINTVERAGTTLLNPPDVVRWNLHKSYLRDLENAGVPIVPTTLVEPDDDRSLETILRERGWEAAVVKPVIGTSSAGIWKTTMETARADQDRFGESFLAARRNGDSASNSNGSPQRLSERGALVQQFAPEVADGEQALVFFEGEYNHAWRSLRAPDELDVETNFDENTEQFEPSPATVESAVGALHAAADVLEVSPSELPYARVDCIVRDGEFRLMELELIEPYLNLGRAEDSVNTLARAVESKLQGASDAT